MPLPDLTVKYFDSAMSGAPALSGTAGALIGVLNACLVNGFGSVTLTSLVIANNVATATVSGGHNFAMIRGQNNATPGVGPVIRIAGATPAALNSDFRIASVPDSTHFAFAVAGIADQTATGTITAKRAPAGWTLQYSGTNIAAYSRPSIRATAMLLSVDDTPAQYPQLVMYETMSAPLTGTGPAPLTGSFYTAKSTAANTTARSWRLVADDCTLYFFAQPDGANWLTALYFGDIGKYWSADQYHCALIANAAASSSSYLYQIGGGVSAALLARSGPQLGGAVGCSRYSHSISGLQLGIAGGTYPGIGGHVFVCGIDVWDSGAARGAMPGFYNPLHANNPPDGYLLDNISGLAGRGLLGVSPGNNGYRALLDLTGPWR